MKMFTESPIIRVALSKTFIIIFLSHQGYQNLPIRLRRSNRVSDECRGKKSRRPNGKGLPYIKCFVFFVVLALHFAL